MSNNEFLNYTGNQVHNIFCALLPEVANNFIIAIYILEITFYLLFCYMMLKGASYFAAGGRR